MSFAQAWIELAGLSAKGVARELKDNQMVIKVSSSDCIDCCFYVSEAAGVSRAIAIRPWSMS